MLQECKFKNFNGSIWVETYEDHEEDDRIKVYDEYLHYIDYINIDDARTEKYDEYLSSMLSVDTPSDFIEWWCPYRYSMADDKLDLMSYVYADEYDTREQDLYAQAVCDELEEDYETLTDKEFCTKYMINKIGNTYFYMGDY